MWPKDAYQEQMLGYLSEVETEIGQIAHVRQHDLNELYADLDTTAQKLWRLIAASDLDWEKLRLPLESSCDRLQRAFYRLLRAGALILSDEAAMDVLHASLTMGAEIRTNPDDIHNNNRYADNHLTNNFTRTLVRKELA